MKVAINKCYGGFQISREGYEWLIKNKAWKVTDYNKSGRGYEDDTAQLVKTRDYKTKEWNGDYYLVHDRSGPEIRTNPDIIEMIETLKTSVNTSVSKLQVIEIPDGIDFEIEEYDGIEWIAEAHRSWS